MEERIFFFLKLSNRRVGIDLAIIIKLTVVHRLGTDYVLGLVYSIDLRLCGYGNCGLFHYGLLFLGCVHSIVLGLGLRLDLGLNYGLGLSFFYGIGLGLCGLGSYRLFHCGSVILGLDFLLVLDLVILFVALALLGSLFRFLLFLLRLFAVIFVTFVYVKICIFVNDHIFVDHIFIDLVFVDLVFVVSVTVIEVIDLIVTGRTDIVLTVLDHAHVIIIDKLITVSVIAYATDTATARETVVIDQIAGDLLISVCIHRYGFFALSVCLICRFVRSYVFIKFAMQRIKHIIGVIVIIKNGIYRETVIRISSYTLFKLIIVGSFAKVRSPVSGIQVRPKASLLDSLLHSILC